VRHRLFLSRRWRRASRDDAEMTQEDGAHPGAGFPRGGSPGSRRALPLPSDDGLRERRDRRQR